MRHSYRSIMRDIIALEAGDGGVDILGPNAESNAFGGPDRSENDSSDNNNQSNNNGNNNTNNLEDISAPTTAGSGGTQNDNNADSNDGNDSADGSDNNSDDSGDDDYSEDTSSNEVNEDETRIKQNTVERMKHLYEVVSTNLDKLTNLNHEIKNINIILYSKVQNRFIQLKEVLFKLISEDEYLNKDCADYVRLYITAKEMYNLCIQYTKEFFDNYDHLRKLEKDKKDDKK